MRYRRIDSGIGVESESWVEGRERCSDLEAMWFVLFSLDPMTTVRYCLLLSLYVTSGVSITLVLLQYCYPVLVGIHNPFIKQHSGVDPGIN